MQNCRFDSPKTNEFELVLPIEDSGVYKDRTFSHTRIAHPVLRTWCTSSLQSAFSAKSKSCPLLGVRGVLLSVSFYMRDGARRYPGY